MNQLADSVISNLKKIVGPENVSDELPDRLAYTILGPTQALPFETVSLKDRSLWPIAVVCPSNAKETSEIVKLANKEATPILHRSRGTGFWALTQVRKPRSIILDLRRMDKFKLDEKNVYIEAGPATIIDKLNEAINPKGYYFPFFQVAIVLLVSEA